MKFQVILADPPWPYDNAKSNRPALGGKTYPTMTMQELYSLWWQIEPVTDKDCVMFMWATLPKIREASELLSRWGFEYITTPFVWVKLNPTGYVTDLYPKGVALAGGVYSGMGHWTCGNVELVLMGKKGAPHRVRKDIKQVVFAPRGRHSEKPEEVQRRIELLMGDEALKLEMFARRERPGWTCVGLDINGFPIDEALKDLAIK